MGGVESPFQFVGYKIDKIQLDVTNAIEIIANTAPIFPESIKMSLSFRHVSRFLTNGKTSYIGGLNINLEILDPNTERLILTGIFGIAGMFTTVEPMDSGNEEALVKLNIPTILMPYLRATITTTLSNAGFGTILMPLINVHETAKSANILISDVNTELTPSVLSKTIE